MILMYLDETRNKKRSAERDICIARHLYRFFSGQEVESLAATDVHFYIADRRRDNVKDSTIRRELALLSSAINHARKWWDWKLANPVSGRRPAQGKRRVRWLSRT
jgi:hypothetical protein